MQLEESIAKELAEIVRSVVDHKFNELVKMIELLPPPEKGERGEKGDKGDPGEKGDIGLPGIAGRDGLPGIPGRDGKDGMPGLNGKDGAPGAPGRDGIDGKDGAGPSRGRHRGPWKHVEAYVIDDMVTFDNSGWVAVVDNPTGKPGASKDWQLFVRKGRDGKDGERGPPGPAGPQGKAAEY